MRACRFVLDLSGNNSYLSLEFPETSKYNTHIIAVIISVILLQMVLLGL